MTGPIGADIVPLPPAADLVACACGCGQIAAIDAIGKDASRPVYIGEYGKRQRRRAVFVDQSHQDLYFSTRATEKPDYTDDVKGGTK